MNLPTIKTTLGAIESARNGGHLAAFRALQLSNMDEMFSREELVLDILAELEKFDAVAIRVMESAGAKKRGSGFFFEEETPEAVDAMRKLNELRAKEVEFSYQPIQGTPPKLGQGAFSPSNLAALRACGIVSPSAKERKTSNE